MLRVVVLFISAVWVSSAHAGVVSSQLLIKDSGGTAQVIEKDENLNATYGSSTRVTGSYTLDTCPLCVGTGGHEATGYAELQTNYGSMSGNNQYFFADTPPADGNRSVTFEHISKFTLDDVTIAYRGIDPIEQALDEVLAELHVTANVNMFGANWFTINSNVNGNADNAVLSTLASGTHPDDVNLSDHLVVFNAGLLPIGETFSLSLSVHVVSGTGYKPFVAAGPGHYARSNWNLVLGGSPALILPDGFYASSADGSIVDNFFVGAPVPVPAAVWLLGTGLFGLIGVAQRKA